MVSANPPSSASRSRIVSLLRYELVTVGDELLLGLTQNGHLAFIGSELGRRGVTLARNVTVTDDSASIARQIRESWGSSDVILTTGGLGPTCDDRTREVVAEVLGIPLVFDAAIEKAIAARFALFGRRMTPNNLKQAYRFETGEVLANPNGTAPGLWAEKNGKVVCMLPGPPNEMQPMFENQVIPRLVERGLLLSEEAYIQLRTAGVGESLLETKLQPIFDRYAGEDLNVAFCAHDGRVDCRLSSPGSGLRRYQLEAIAGECASLLGEDFVGYGNDSLAKVCADLLRAQDKRIAVAETGTGGRLATAFNDVCGVSKFFAGGCVCCTNDSRMQLLDIPECVLMQHGAASAECAVAMATGAAENLGADYAIAVTGFGGPCGGPNENPVGTIYIALHAPQGVWAKKLSYPGPRKTIKERAINDALDWLRRELVRARNEAAVRRDSGVMP